MGKVQVLRLSHKHQEILHYMIANPAEKLGDVALRYGVTPAWLSTLVHSDAFQEELRKKQDEVFHPAMVGVHDRLTGVAHLLIDKMEEMVENNKFTPGQVLEASDSVLDRLGYGTKGAGAPAGGVTINNYASVPAGAVAQARERWMTAQRVEDEPEAPRAIEPPEVRGLGDEGEEEQLDMFASEVIEAGGSGDLG